MKAIAAAWMMVLAGILAFPSTVISADAATSTSGATRTKAEIDALINKEGRTPPTWFSSTPLNYPKTLQLKSPKNTAGGRKNKVKVGKYRRDEINHN